LDKIKEKALIIPVDTQKHILSGLKMAGQVILSGRVVAFPTESFYGLAVNATDDEAIQDLIILKERQGDHPILILIPSEDVLEQYVTHIPEIARRLIKEFWPGGMTIIFEAGKSVSPLLTAGTGKIGVRVSSHPIATGLARAAGVPISGTSANITGRLACANSRDVFRSLGRKVDLILDGGETKGGEGSTIIDVTVHPPVMVREGIVSRDRLKGYLTRS